MSSAKKQLSGIRNKQQFLYVLVFSLAAAGVWIGGSLFFSQRKTGIEPELLELAEPLNPNINISALERIEAKKSFTAAELSNFGIYKIVTSRDGKEQRVVTLDVPDDILETQPAQSPSPTPGQGLAPFTATQAGQPNQNSSAAPNNQPSSSLGNPSPPAPTTGSDSTTL